MKFILTSMQLLCWIAAVGSTTAQQQHSSYLRNNNSNNNQSNNNNNINHDQRDLKTIQVGGGGGKSSFEICHFSQEIGSDPYTDFKTIMVKSTQAMEAHLSNHHGDLLGPCDEHCDEICDDNNKCTINHYDDCEESGGCLVQPDHVDCDDHDACTIDTCDPLTGCVHDKVHCDDGYMCDPLDGECIDINECYDDSSNNCAKRLATDPP